MKGNRIAVLTTLACTLLSAQNQISRLNVAVSDRKGQPATGLHAADFKIQEDGKTRDIVFVRFTGDRPDAARQAMPGESSNRASKPPRATVILLDLLNNEVMTGPMISDQLTRAFRNIESSENLYLYFLTTGGELFPVHPLPKRGAPLAETARQWSRNLTSLLEASLKTLSGFRPVDDYDVKMRVELTTHALLDLGSQMEVIPGRKNVVWVSHGIPLNGFSIAEHSIVDFTGTIRTLAERLQFVQIAVYPVGAPLDSESDLSLNEISGLTGGRKFAFGAVAEAVREAEADTRANYLIAYDSAAEAPAKTLDGKHRKVRVTCARKDLRVQTVSGFYQLVAMPQPGDVQRALVEMAIHSPLDGTDIGVRASATNGPRETRFDVRVDAADLLLRQSNGGRTGCFTLVFATYGAAGVLGSGRGLRQEINLTADEYAAALRDGIAVQQSIALGPDVRSVRAIVADEQLGSAGSVTVPIQR